MEADTLIIGASAAGLAVARCLRRPAASLSADRGQRRCRRRCGATPTSRLHLHTPRGRARACRSCRCRAAIRAIRRGSRSSTISSPTPRRSDAAAASSASAVTRISPRRRWLARRRPRRRSHRGPQRRRRHRQHARPGSPAFAGRGAFRRADPPLVGLSHRRGLSRPARAGRRLRQFGLRDRHRSRASRAHRRRLRCAGAVNVIPRELLGIPITSSRADLSSSSRRASPMRSMRRCWRLLSATSGRSASGSCPTARSSRSASTSSIPLIDIGTLALIRSGAIAVRPGVARFTPTGRRVRRWPRGEVRRGGPRHRLSAPRLATCCRTCPVSSTPNGTPLVSGGDGGARALFLRVPPHLRRRHSRGRYRDPAGSPIVIAAG